MFTTLSGINVIISMRKLTQIKSSMIKHYAKLSHVLCDLNFTPGQENNRKQSFTLEFKQNSSLESSNLQPFCTTTNQISWWEGEKISSVKQIYQKGASKCTVGYSGESVLFVREYSSITFGNDSGQTQPRNTRSAELVNGIQSEMLWLYINPY